MFIILERYISRIILKMTTIILFVLISLSGIIKFVDELKKIGQGSYSVSGVSLYIILNIPKDIEIFFPMAVLLGVLLGLGSLSIKNELITIYASGFSYLQLTFLLMKITIPIILFNIFIEEFVTPSCQTMAYNYRTKMMHSNSILSTKNGFWAKDGNDFIFIGKIKEKNIIYDLCIYHFNSVHKLEKLRYAEKATFCLGMWKLSKIEELDINDKKRILNKKVLNSEWNTTLTPDKIYESLLKFDSLTIFGLYKHIQYLKHNKQDPSYYQLSMWNKIFSPLSILAMILMALSCIFGPLKNVKLKIQMITGISLSFFFYVLEKTFGSLSLVYKVYPMIGSFLPKIIFLIISSIILSMSFSRK